MVCGKKFDEVKKKHSRTSPDAQFKEFLFTKQNKLDLESTMN